eukprot:TRINITY_DN20990_c0_g1_i1.p1 TRINITY_DN20990_c0_g1~~TRINITY_DN20990_c0_g1_i1.p1  ORF type:complete len:163 (-),score=25.77 TRINITY_DN20990_c0_g1_i1:522-950(-)
MCIRDSSYTTQMRLNIGLPATTQWILPRDNHFKRAIHHLYGYLQRDLANIHISMRKALQNPPFNVKTRLRNEEFAPINSSITFSSEAVIALLPKVKTLSLEETEKMQMKAIEELKITHKVIGEHFQKSSKDQNDQKRPKPEK